MGVTLEELDQAYQLANVGDRIAVRKLNSRVHLYKCADGTAWWEGATEKLPEQFKGWYWLDGRTYALRSTECLLKELSNYVDPGLLWE